MKNFDLVPLSVKGYATLQTAKKHVLRFKPLLSEDLKYSIVPRLTADGSDIRDFVIVVFPNQNQTQQCVDMMYAGANVYCFRA